MEVKKLWVGAFGEVYITTQVLELWNNRAHEMDYTMPAKEKTKSVNNNLLADKGKG